MPVYPADVTAPLMGQRPGSLWGRAWRPNAAPSSGAFLLDLYPTASMAYSFRKLRAAYAGSAVRIRRSSDNAEASIGFLANGDFDSAAAAAHIGGGTGFIVTWFDQSGNGIDVTQATVAQQPAYSATGMNAKPTMSFDGSNDDLVSAGIANTAYNPTNTTIMAAQLHNTVIFASLFSGAAGSAWLQIWNGTIYFQYGPTQTVVTVPVGFDGAAHLLEMGRDVGNAQFVTVDGVEIVRGAATAGITVGTAPFYVGYGDVGGGFWSGLQSELVIWAADLAANRSAARANIQTYWLPTPTLLLDVLGVSATRAYSTRKLRSAYAGSAIRIRRSSDNAEQDIGFSGEDLDTAAITTFVGANSAYVVKMYDQSGTGDDCVQATAADQPRIVNTGVLDTGNGKPIAFFASGQYLVCSVNSQIRTFGLLCAVNEPGPVISDWRAALSYATSGIVALCSQSGSPPWDITYTPISTNGGANTVVFGGVLQNVRGTAVSPGVTDKFQIGRNQNVVGAQFWKGWVGEAVTFATQLSAPNYATLYTNQAAYWGTP